MTEHSPVATQELRPLSDNERAFLSVEQADDWRAMQHGVQDRMRSDSRFDDDTYVTRFNESIDDSLEAYLNAHNIDEDNPRRDDFRKAFRAISLDRISDDQWLAKPSARGENVQDSARDVSGRDLFAQLRDSAPAFTTDTQLASDIDRHDAVEAARETVRVALETSREDFAVKSAKRQGRAIGKGGIEYEQSQQRYFADVQENGRMKFADEIARQDDMSDSEKQALNTQVIEYLFAEQKTLRDNTTEKLRGTKLNKVFELINRGSLKMRIAKGVGLGILAGATGAFIVGAAGAAVAGTAVIGASRFVRGYAAHDKNIGSDEYTAEDQTAFTTAIQTNARADTAEDYLDQGGLMLRDWHESDTKSEQNKRKWAFVGGAGSVIAGTLIGYGLHAAAESWQGKNLSLFGGHDVDANVKGTPAANPNQYFFDDTNGDTKGPYYPDSDGGGAGIDVDATAPHELANPAEAYTVKCGEGWNQTFKEMGIPKTQWDGVLKDAGPELSKQGWAYFDDAHGEWRITKPGTLSQQAMETITKASTKHGYGLAA